MNWNSSTVCRLLHERRRPHVDLRGKNTHSTTVTTTDTVHDVEVVYQGHHVGTDPKVGVLKGLGTLERPEVG